MSRRSTLLPPTNWPFIGRAITRSKNDFSLYDRADRSEVGFSRTGRSEMADGLGRGLPGHPARCTIRFFLELIGSTQRGEGDRVQSSRDGRGRRDPDRGRGAPRRIGCASRGRREPARDFQPQAPAAGSRWSGRPCSPLAFESGRGATATAIFGDGQGILRRHRPPPLGGDRSGSTTGTSCGNNTRRRSVGWLE